MTFERLYAIKLGFAVYMVETRGASEDYERLRYVQKEALDKGLEIDIDV